MMSKVPEPAQVVLPSVAVEVNVITYPTPAGRPPMVVVSFVELDTLIVPAFVKALGPVMV
jgi:hypothetical protein